MFNLKTIGQDNNIILNHNKQQFIIILTNHLFEKRGKKNIERFSTFSKNEIKQIILNAIVNTNLLDRQFVKTGIIFPSKTDKEDQYSGFLVSVENLKIVLVSIFDEESEDYRKVGIFNKVEKVFLDNYDHSTVYNPHNAPLVKDNKHLMYHPRHKKGLSIVKKAKKGYITKSGIKIVKKKDLSKVPQE